MKIFIIADLHLSQAVDKPMDCFGKRWFQHTERLVAHWREEICAEDVVLLPGDISWGMHLREAKPDLALLAELPGKKIFLRGNHDYWWSSLSKLNSLCQREGWNDFYFLQNNAIPIGETFVVAGTRFWLYPDDQRFQQADQRILHREMLRLDLSLKAAEEFPNRRLVVMFHYPPFGKDKRPNAITAKLKEARAHAAYFGHIHHADSPYGMQDELIDGVPYSLISADYLDFVPRCIAVE